MTRYRSERDLFDHFTLEYYVDSEQLNASHDLRMERMNLCSDIEHPNEMTSFSVYIALAQLTRQGLYLYLAYRCKIGT